MDFQEGLVDQYIILPHKSYCSRHRPVGRSSSNLLLAVVLDGLQLPFRFEPPEVGLLAYLGNNFLVRGAWL